MKGKSCEQELGNNQRCVESGDRAGDWRWGCDEGAA